MLTRQDKFYVGLFLWVIVLFNLIVVTTYRGLWAYPVALILAASPVTMYYLATRLEKREWQDLLSLKHGSWAFLLGDTFCVAPAVGMASYNWQTLPLDGWYYRWWWPVVCLVAGGVAGVAFHRADRGNYIRAGIPRALVSPTKQAHDRCTYTVLFGGALFTILPIVIEMWNTGKYPLMCLGGWGLLCICDMVRKLDPTKLHVEWDEDEFKLVA